MRLFAITLGSLIAAAGCASDPGLGAARQELGACGLGDEELAVRTYTTSDIASLSAVQKAQFIAAVRESAWNDITTIEQAFQVVDEHEIIEHIQRDSGTNQFYVEVRYHVGDNPYGAVLYWGTAVVGAAIHDGFPEECGPLTFNYDQGDTAPECHGFLDYTNTATFAQLDAYLPSNVAQNIVDARAQHAFDSVASVIAVNGVAETRLQQLLSHARIDGFVGASCSGIYDQIAISTTEESAMIAFANEASSEELHGVLAFELDQTVVGYLIAARPLSTAGGISNVYRVGPATFRTLRNAATAFQPFEELVAEVNEITHPDALVRLDLHFDWLSLVTGAGDHVSSMICFGVDPALLPPGATDRPELADGPEVQGVIAGAVSLANAWGELDVDPAAGLADLAFRTDGHAFFGCYIQSRPNPWVYDNTTFFVDTDTGASYSSTSHYVE